MLDHEDQGLLHNESDAQAVISTEFLNTVYPPTIGKIRKTVKYGKVRLGDKFRRTRGIDDLEKDVDYLYFILNTFGFNYLGPDKNVKMPEPGKGYITW